MERTPWGQKEVDANAKEQAKGRDNLKKGLSEFNSLYQDNPTHAYNPSTGQLEKI